MQQEGNIICPRPRTILAHSSSHAQRARAGAKIGYCSQLISSEEAPAKEVTLRKQRLRWAQGWFEVSLRHLLPLMLSCHTSVRQKLGFFTLLAFREVFVYFTFHPIVLVVAYVLRDSSRGIDFFFLTVGATIFSVGPIRVIAAYLLSRGEVSKHGSVFVLYGVAQLFWSCYLNIVQVRCSDLMSVCDVCANVHDISSFKLGRFCAARGHAA